MSGGLIYADICAGISSATVAWKPLRWRAAFYAETDKFPSAVLAHHYPATPNLGDITRYEEWPDADFDVLIGGTPCQGFSIAGKRKGLGDPRSNLALCFGRIAERYKPRWIVWENVPGVRSQDEGRALGAFLRGLDELGYGLCWRSLDAQYAGLAQRRERLFVVGYLGDWRPAAAVLFEPAGMRWDPPPRREARERAADSLTVGANQYSGFCGEPVAAPIASCADGGSGYRLDADTADSLIPVVANPLTHRMHKGVNTTCDEGQTMIAQALRGKAHSAHRADIETYVVRGEVRLQGGDGQTAGSLKVGGGKPGQGYPAIVEGWAVRRLTPRECERLMGYPDDFTRIAWRGKPAEACPDGPRYKALGNSIDTHTLRWIGQRIMLCEEAITSLAEAA
jgi:DNA (cytosine-5)-methyltransferase 1